MRLIDADALKRYIDMYNVACGCNDDHQKEILEAIDHQDMVELSKNKDLGTLVELVTCKDCKHRPVIYHKGYCVVPPTNDDDEDCSCPCLCDDPFYAYIPRDDFFCANGERREG